MTTIVRFTALSGARDRKPLCYLLEVRITNKRRKESSQHTLAETYRFQHTHSLLRSFPLSFSLCLSVYLSVISQC